MSFRDFVSSWTHGPDWKTWVAHSALALVIASGAGLAAWAAGAADWAIIGGAVAAGYYLLRELEQCLYSFVAHESVRAHALDHVLDVVAPAAAVLAVVGLVSVA